MILRNLKILFIDDEPDYVIPISDYLAQTYQHVTTTVPSAEGARRKLEKEHFDIIFVDYKLGTGTGLDFLKWAIDRKLDTPVVMVTGHGREDVAVEAMKLGAYDYLNKTDIRLDLLPIVINNTLDRFVLRKAKEELDGERLTKERNELAISVFQETVKEFVSRISLDLENILLRVKMYGKQRSVKRSPENVERDMNHLIGEVEYSAKAIEAAVSALMSLNASVTNLVDVQKQAVDLQEELSKTLKQMEVKRGQAGG